MTDEIGRRHRSMRQPRSAWRRHPVGPLSLHGDRRPRMALAGAVLVDQLHATSSSRWRRCSRARTSNTSASSAFPTRMRRASSSMPRTLFERDKFSGYDRIEGGTRANLGLRYSGTYDNGWTTNALLGQSYQLGRRELVRRARTWSMSAPFPAWRRRPPTMSACSASPRPIGLSSSVSARLDEQTFEVRRAELKAGYGGAAALADREIRLHPGAAALRLSRTIATR